jgi:hypothetical protein
VNDAMLQRCLIVQAGSINNLQLDQAVVVEKAPVDDQFDSLFRIGFSGYKSEGIGKQSGATGSGSWKNAGTSAARGE